MSKHQLPPEDCQKLTQKRAKQYRKAKKRNKQSQLDQKQTQLEKAFVRWRKSLESYDLSPYNAFIMSLEFGKIKCVGDKHA